MQQRRIQKYRSEYRICRICKSNKKLNWQNDHTAVLTDPTYLAANPDVFYW